MSATSAMGRWRVSILAPRLRWALLGLLCAGLVLAAWWNSEDGTERRAQSPRQMPGEPAAANLAPATQLAANPAASPAAKRVVQLTADEMRTADVRVAPAERGAFTETLWVTGKVALNEDRVAHIFPLVEGRAETVSVRFGDDVRAGQELATVQSKEVGRAKLELFKDRLARQFAAARNEWSRRINDNTQELIKTLEKGEAFDAIETKFRDRPMGDYREKLLSAYADLYRSEADYRRLESLAGTGIAPTKQLTAAKAARDADAAKLQAWLEQVKYTAQQAALESDQLLREAETRVSTDETYLQILGYPPAALAKIDPQEEGSALSHYPITAPFDGTVIAKDVVLMERVSPEHQVFQLADLSTVWVKADIYEQQLPRLHGLKGRDVKVRSKVWPGREFTAQVFFTGELVDEASRTISMTAKAENSERLLKPGMFVEVELPGAPGETVVQVPQAAVQENEGKTFVFVQATGGVFEPKEIVIGRREGSRVEVLQGLQGGEPIAISGGFVLKSRMLAELLTGDE